MTFVRVQVSGDKSVIKALRTLGLKTKDLSGAWQRIGARIREDAIPLTPVLSGRLVRSIKNSKGKTRTTVRARTPKTKPYAAIQHYGGYHNIQAKPFLVTALHMNEDYAEKEVSSEIDRLIRSVGLD